MSLSEEVKTEPPPPPKKNTYENAVQDAGHVMEETFLASMEEEDVIVDSKEEENHCEGEEEEVSSPCLHRLLCANLTTDGEIGKI